jgi:HD-GYP domain-containing protein (c-di-GMP phosphodiesterase class II)
MATAAALDLDSTALVEESRAWGTRRFAARELRASLVVGALFLAAALPLAALLPDTRHPSALVVLALVLGYALVGRVEFEVGSGVAVPTQLVLVPMLFLLPLGLVPLCVTAGLVLHALLDRRSLRRYVERLPLRLVNSWHAVGPVAVLAAFGGSGFAWTRWPVYAAALGAQFALDIASVAARQTLAGRFSAGSQVRFMGTVYLVDAGLAPVALALVGTGRSWAPLLALPLVALLSVFARERQVRIDHALELGHAYRGTALLLGDVVEADDAYTGSHSRDVVDLVLAVSGELGLSPAERRHAEFAALLHDVGKVRIPSEIINKPGPLTPEERAVIETHTIEGEQMLDRIGGLLGEVGRIVRSCHERVDGGGYPDGLAGDEIPLIARIVCCCDAYSAMTTDRPYRKARPPEAALEELRRCAGTQFDSSVVEALARVV